MAGLKGALALRVSDGVNDRHVTRYSSGLKFTKTAPGGHQSMSFRMSLPRNTFTDLGPEDRTYLYDSRTGRTVFEGYLENPTPIDGPDGQMFDISAVGGMALANDETRALVYVSRDLGQFEKDPAAAAAASFESGRWATTPTYERLRVAFPGGGVAATNVVSSAGDYEFGRAGMPLGGVRVGTVISGKSDANWSEQITTDPSGTQIFGRPMSTTGTTGTEKFVGDTGFPTGVPAFWFRLQRVGGATNVADDLTWTDWVDVSVIGQRMNRFGALLTGSAGLVSAQQVMAHQVVEDLLGRVLTFCDPMTAQVDVTTFPITQLSYPDGVKAAGVLNDLSVFEAGFLWEVLETNDSGKHRFNFRAWPSAARYEVSVKDGWRQSGSDVDLCNRILVSWNDALGNRQVTTVTASGLGLTGIGLPVDALGSRVKDADPVSLPDGKGSIANATQIGEQILRDKINPPTAGTAVVRRSLVDQLTGNVVMPWELEPGYVCRLRETGDDLRITQVDYDDDTCSAVLTLGTPVESIDQRLARLDRAVPTTLVGS